MERVDSEDELTTVKAALAKWRAEGGGRGSKIPDELWRAAARLARTAGVWRTAKALNLKYEGLRARVELGEGGSGGRPARTPVEARRARPRRPDDAEAMSTPGAASAEMSGSTPPAFVALEMGPPPVASQTVIELHGRHGDRMRIEVPVGVDVCGLVERFWSRQP